MLGIGCPDRHALPRIIPIKSADHELRSPPARAGSFIGASRPLSLRARIGSSCPIAAVRIRSEDCWGESEAVIRSGRPPKASLARYGRYRLSSPSWFPLLVHNDNAILQAVA
jgi:hypothetical protein